MMRRGGITLSTARRAPAAPRPLEFEGFRASRKDKRMEKMYAPLSECDMNPVGCAIGDVADD